MPTIQDFQSPILPTWCAGCGDFAIWTAIKMALVQLGYGPMDTVLCFDIGCNGNMADKINAYVFKGLHGRVLPLSAGISLANKNIPVIAVAGDGGTFDEGMHHFIHTIRSNYNVTFILHNNCDFGLTTGQATPTTPVGQKMNGTPYGVVEKQLNPTQLAILLGGTFVAKAFTGNIPQLVNLLKEGIGHKGFSYIEVLQHCPTYNKFKDHTFLAQRVFDVQTLEGYTGSYKEAMEISDYSHDKIATGLLYREANSQSYLQNLKYKDQTSEATLVDEVKQYPIADLLSNYV